MKILPKSEMLERKEKQKGRRRKERKIAKKEEGDKGKEKDK